MTLSYAFSAAPLGLIPKSSRIERRPEAGSDRNRCARDQPRKLRAGAQNKP
jgi:hypothetical protein